MKAFRLVHEVLPPMLAEALGYGGDSRWVGIYNDSESSAITLSDGLVDTPCSMRSWVLYSENPLFKAKLEEALAISDDDPCLLIDRENHQMKIAPVFDALNFMKESIDLPDIESEECLQKAFDAIKEKMEQEKDLFSTPSGTLREETLLLSLQSWMLDACKTYLL